MPKQTNLFGAFIFWFYILAALIFTFFAIDSILKSPNPTPHKHVATFTILAFISFSTMSFNMLHVLFDSYNTWSARQISPLTLSPSSIWNWSITSTLFRNFGEAIVGDDARFFWTQSALLWTMSICFFMGVEGSRNRIPRLWAFFALSQILPISFAQNLFSIALLRSKDAKGPSVSVSRNSTLVVITTYCGCLLVAPQTADGPYLMPTIIVARLLLSVPYFLPELDNKKNSSATARAGRLDHWQTQNIIGFFAAVMIIKQIAFIVHKGYTSAEVLAALFSHPAVTSLGFDFLVAIASFVAWIWIQSDSKQPSVAQLKNAK